MNKTRLAIAVAAAAAAPAMLFTSPVFGQATGMIEEVVVTAQKRDQNILDVPLSIVALSKDDLEQAGVNSALDLSKLVPNFYATRGTAAANTRFVIRGIGTAGNTAVDQSTAVFLDGVYIARPSMLYSSFLDIDSVEVVRGPQGTLFGRNTTAGGIIMRSTRPTDERSFEGLVEAGNYGRQKFEGIVNTPLGDRARLRLAGQGTQSDGFGTQLSTGREYGEEESVALRAALDLDIGSSTAWTLRVDHSDLEGDGRSANEAIGDTLTPQTLARFTRSVGGPQNLPELQDPTDWKVNQLVGGSLDDEQMGFSSDLTHDFDNGYSLSLISGWRDYDNEQTDQDILFLPLELIGRTAGVSSESLSHELRLVSPIDLMDGRFNYVAGLYYYEEDAGFTESLSLTPTFCAAFLPPPLAGACLAGPLNPATALDFQQTSESIAAYSQGDYSITDRFMLQLGVRYTRDERDGRFLQEAANPIAAALLRAPEDTTLSFSDENPTYRVALNFTPTAETLVFASASTGYKSGGFNSGGGQRVLGAADRTFDSESAKNFELGGKGTFLDGRLDAALTFYRTEIDDFQARSFDGNSFLTRNAGSLRHQGFEADTRLNLSENIWLSAGLAYLDSEFTEFSGAQALPGCAPGSPAIDGCGPLGGDRSVQDLTGGRAHFAPEWTGNLVVNASGNFAQWYWRGNLSLNYMGEQFAGGALDNNPQAEEDAYFQLSSRITLTSPSERFEFSIFGQNLTNEEFCSIRFYQPFGRNLGVTDAATGGTLVRCNAGAPRTVGASFAIRL